MFHAVYHFLPHAVLFLRLYHLLSCTSLVPSMGRSRPNWNVTFVQVHPLLLNFFNHSLVLYPGPWVTVTLQVSPPTSQASDGRVGLVHATRPTRSIPFRRYIFWFFSLGLIFMWRLNKNNISNLVHFAETKMRICGLLPKRKQKLLCLSPCFSWLNHLVPNSLLFYAHQVSLTQCGKLCN